MQTPPATEKGLVTFNYFLGCALCKQWCDMQEPTFVGVGIMSPIYTCSSPYTLIKALYWLYTCVSSVSCELASIQSYPEPPPLPKCWSHMTFLDLIGLPVVCICLVSTTKKLHKSHQTLFHMRVWAEKYLPWCRYFPAVWLGGLAQLILTPGSAYIFCKMLCVKSRVTVTCSCCSCSWIA